MAQAEQKTIDIYDKVPTKISTLSTDSGGYISIPAELVSPYVQTATHARIELLEKQLMEAKEIINDRDKIIESQKDALGDYALELHLSKKRIDSLEKLTKNQGLTETKQNKDFHPVIYCLSFRDKNGKTPSKEWVQKLWNTIYELTQLTDSKGGYITNCAEVIVPIFKVLTESTSLPYLFKGTREDFAYQWNENVVERIDDKERANKLTCKHKSLDTALVQPCWKNVSPTRWKTQSLEGGKYMDKYAKGVTIKNHIENSI